MYSYLYIFDWKILSPDGQNFSQPKNIINMNNLQSYEVKKDMKIELIEIKKGLFSSTKKTIIKPHTIDDLEDWVHKIEDLLKL